MIIVIASAQGEECSEDSSKTSHKCLPFALPKPILNAAEKPNSCQQPI